MAEQIPPLINRDAARHLLRRYAVKRRDMLGLLVGSVFGAGASHLVDWQALEFPDAPDAVPEAHARGIEPEVGLDPRMPRGVAAWHAMIRKTLARMAEVDPRYHSRPAEYLLLGTVAIESAFGTIEHSRPMDGLGPWQITATTALATHRLMRRQTPTLLRHVEGIVPLSESALLREIASDARTGCVLARRIYWPVTEIIPPVGDIAGHARYWANHYHGSADPAAYVQAWQQHVAAYADAQGWA